MSPSVRRYLIVGNWKMNKRLAEAGGLAAQVAQGARRCPRTEVVLAPPYLAVPTVREAVKGSGVGVAGQDASWEEWGAFTGEVSAPMLRDAGCTHVILGHSERRIHLGESDALLARKLRAALAAELAPILCVGERLEERRAGRQLEVVEGQLLGGLEGLAGADGLGRTAIAYEPVWAIGTGEVATPEQAQEAHGFIRRLLKERFGPAAAEATRILYGGSVNPENVSSLLTQADVDGALVGGASLKAESFLTIVAAAEKQAA
ncbi:MAG: triose-phosphate isomerase [Nitrospinota bacterium]